ncbi:fructokinase [Streptohalobacillus salinus]|uniref:Fructokinase n=1 Tax=Streptohalobacillus salinus TaxID=621096 RepID=A0A2V3WHU8_9BACI|nr:carbohydrate kinase [Streptohalobacillus salinus]PXW93094.1 fructokinase [Streptohalobacillus salinus]
MSRVYSIGEALIDFIPSVTDSQLKDVPSFKRVMGGAPANVAVAVARLGGQSAFISKRGEDAFGEHITEQLQHFKVDTTHLLKTTEANTGLAFVSLKQDGQRDFSFYRKPSADMLLSKEEVRDLPFEPKDLLHFCSVDLIEAPVKYAHIEAIEHAKRELARISFDPNVRLPLWESEEACKAAIQAFIPYADILKVSDEELYFITGIEDEAAALQSLFRGDVSWVIYTRGKDGAVFLTKDKKASHPGFKVEAIDTTGAGDAFIGALLYQVSRDDQALTAISEQAMHDYLAFSNAFAALTTTKNGAVESLPTIAEVHAFLNENS